VAVGVAVGVGDEVDTNVIENSLEKSVTPLNNPLTNFVEKKSPRSESSHFHSFQDEKVFTSVTRDEHINYLRTIKTNTMMY